MRLHKKNLQNSWNKAIPFITKKLANMSCPQLNSKNNGLGLLFKTIL